MLLDAIRAELIRFSHNTAVWLWALLVIPFGGAIAGIFTRQFLTVQLDKAIDSAPVQIQIDKSPLVLIDVIADQASSLASINILAFFLIAAAAISAADYRWETWRLIRPRNSRFNLIIGKAAAIGLLALIPLTLQLLCETLGQIVSATIESRPIALGFDIKTIGATFMMFLLSWIRTLQVAALALLTAIVTRSMFGGYVIPVGVSVGTFLLAQMLANFGWGPDQWRTLLIFPATAHDMLQSAAAGGPVSAMTVVKSLLGLILWLVLPTGLAVWYFESQDLSKE